MDQNPAVAKPVTLLHTVIETSYAIYLTGSDATTTLTPKPGIMHKRDCYQKFLHW